MKFYYDAEGRPMCLDYNGTMYFYITNLQGDVVAISDEYGEVIRYEYDAWGKPIVSEYYFSSHSEVMQYNPLRYRGYIYDAETGFYYLQSRYYDPAVGRFINSDGVGYLGATGTFLSFNLFAYCENNPVMGYDPMGTISLREAWDNIKSVIGLAVIKSEDYDVISIHTLFGGFESGASMQKTLIGDASKFLSFFLETPQNNSAFKAGVQVNINDGGVALATGDGNVSVTMAGKNESLEIMLGINKIGFTYRTEIDFGDRTSSEYVHGYIRTVPTAAAVIVSVGAILAIKTMITKAAAVALAALLV